MAPSVRNVGTASSGGTSSPHSVNTPTIVSGDLVACVLELGLATAVSATGWTQSVLKSQTAPTGSTVLCVMTRIADGTEGASVSFTITGTLNHVHGQMLSVQSHGLSTVSDLVLNTATSGAAGTTPTTGDATVTADSLILVFGTSSLDANTTTEFTGWTNGNLSSITERMDSGVLTGNGGAFGCATGVCAGTSIGTTTWSLGSGTTEAWTGTQIGVKPVAAAGAIFFSQSESLRQDPKSLQVISFAPTRGANY